MDKAQVWYRGCISEYLVEDIEEDECGNVLHYLDVLGAVVPPELEVSAGGVCICDDNLCNTLSTSAIVKVTTGELLYQVNTRCDHNARVMLYWASVLNSDLTLSSIEPKIRVY